MIKIIQAQDNTVVLTLLEKQTLVDPAFLFSFYNQMTGETKVFTAEDESLATSRYNKFTITETTSEDLYNGMVSLQSGNWMYTIYEIVRTSPQNLDPDDAAGIVETGKVVVISTTPSLMPDSWDPNWVKDTPEWNG